MVSLQSPIADLYRVGKNTSRLLKKLGLENVQDLLFYFPFRYDDFRDQQDIASLRPGQNANVVGTIELIQNKRSPRKKMNITEALISDSTETLKVVWFNQPFLTRTFKNGDQISLAGKATEHQGQIAMISPRYEKAYSDSLVHTQGLVPNYHLTANLTQKQIRHLLKEVVPLANEVLDWLPIEIKKNLELDDLGTALRQIHFPANREEITRAEKRLAFSELFLRQIKAQLIKHELKSRRAITLRFQEEATKNFVKSLPFTLTAEQKKAAWTILQDLKKTEPMNRLLEGEVGSGKTLVAVLAILNTALNKRQAVMMAPTEILAEQHYASFSKLLAGYNIQIALLTGSHKDDIGTADIIIGTHALIQKNVRFNNLALAVVDEQHHFGVQERQKILYLNSDSDRTPHFLSLTATPIPRSLALAIYGDLDLSIIKELPAGRKPIITKIITEERRDESYRFIHSQILSGRQAFVICPLIDESDKLGVKSVKAEYERLSQEIFPDLKVGLLHGRLKSAEKTKIMNDFMANKIPILVSTSVVEAGIDVPNANLILIEGADRFGLSQLHQFRGRVGRGEHQSYCFLFPSREEITNPKTIERLNAMAKYGDGYTLAKVDLKLRGAGELYGLVQSGFNDLQIASLFDYEMIKKAQTEAAAIISSDPELKHHPLIKEKLGDWNTAAHLE